jgi:hypothetical protein
VRGAAGVRDHHCDAPLGCCSYSKDYRNSNNRVRVYIRTPMNLQGRRRKRATTSWTSGNWRADRFTQRLWGLRRVFPGLLSACMAESVAVSVPADLARVRRGGHGMAGSGEGVRGGAMKSARLRAEPATGTRSDFWGCPRGDLIGPRHVEVFTPAKWADPGWKLLRTIYRSSLKASVCISVTPSMLTVGVLVD